MNRVLVNTVTLTLIGLLLIPGTAQNPVTKTSPSS